jgi:glycerophosphoryl diester phosphodiesterase
LARVRSLSLRRPLGAGEPEPWVIAHRGHSAAAPENTAAAFDAALREPIDGIELDVQMSADGVPVIHHDATVAKLGGGRRRISSLGLAELRTLDAGTWMSPRFRGERLLTLEEVLDRWGGRTWLLLEIKARASDKDPAWHRLLAERTLEQVHRRGLADRVMLLCFDARVLRAPACGAVRTVWNLAKLPRMDEAAQATIASLFAFSVDIRALTPRFAETARRLGKPVLTYTCNTARAVARARAAGVDGIMSDDPALLAARLPHPARPRP